MIDSKEMEKYKATISMERLSAFIYSDVDNIDDIITRYQDNIKISQSLYPELSVLEITLRNTIDTAFKTQFGEEWLESEVHNHKFLNHYDYNTLLKAYNDVKEECSKHSKKFTIGKVIANLNFGFWTNICQSKYNVKVWTKKGVFKGVFANYPKEKQQQIHAISNTLNSIRKLRNRVFHYERVLKNPVSILKKYNEILEILDYLPQNNHNILKNTSTFLNVYNEITVNKAKT